MVAQLALVLALAAPTWIGLDGRSKSVVASGKKGAVVFFVLPDCPIANGYAPEMERIRSQYADSLSSWKVYCEAGFLVKNAKKHTTEYKWNGLATLNGPSAKAAALTSTFKVSVAPTAILFDKSGKVVYRGRIDDRYYALGKQRPKATRRDLRLAIDALIAGKPIPKPQGEPIGCTLTEY